MGEFAVRVGLDMIYQDEYDLDHFLPQIAGKGADRCEHCYRFRLAEAALAAKKYKAAAFTTSLLYSKYQKHDLIASLGKEMAAEQGVEFYYEDFRRGWREGIVESKAMGLYRQQYCGCIYSEKDRYAPKTAFNRTNNLKR